MLDATEDWLYDEGEDQSRGVYVAKLTDLKKIGQPIVDRFVQFITCWKGWLVVVTLFLDSLSIKISQTTN